MRGLLSVIFWGGALIFPCCVGAQEKPVTPPQVIDPVWLWEFDAYEGDHTLNDEKARLGNFSQALKRTPESQYFGYLLVYAGRRACANEAQKHSAWAKHFLVNELGVPPHRIVTIDGGHREQATVTMWIRPRDVGPPEANPSVSPNDARIVKRCRWEIPARRKRKLNRVSSK
jgi:hypothetical protein